MRRADSSTRDSRQGARLHELDDDLRGRVAAEAVDTRLDGLQVALLHAQRLDAPRHPRRDARVGVHDTGVAQLPAQQVGDDLLVVGHPDVLAREALGHRVVRHDHRRPGLDRRLPRLEVVVEVPARVDLVLAPREVRVLPAARRARAGEVLRGQRDAPGPQLAALEPANDRRDHLRGETCVLSEGLPEAPPPRLGRHVGRGVVGAPDAHRHVLLRGDARELLHQGGVARRREAEGPRPLRERARGLGDPERGRGPVVVARVRDEEHRGAEAAPFRQLLHGVEPGRHRPRVAVLPVDELHDVALGEGVRGRRGDERHRSPAERVGAVDRLLAHGTARPHGERRADHEARLLLQGHLGGEVPRALGHGEPPVLVGVEAAVLVEVLEESAVHPEKLHHPSAELGLGRRHPRDKGRGQGERERTCEARADERPADGSCPWCGHHRSISSSLGGGRRYHGEESPGASLMRMEGYPGPSSRQ